MPIYIFQHPNTKKVIEVIQPMNAEHTYIDKEGTSWNRLFTSPTCSTKGTPLDFRSEKDKQKWESIYKKRYNYKNNKK